MSDEKTLKEKLDEIRANKEKEFPSEDSIEPSEGDVEEMLENLQTAMNELEDAQGKNIPPEMTTVVASETKKVAEQLLEDTTDWGSGEENELSIDHLLNDPVVTEKMSLRGKWNILIRLILGAKELWEQDIRGCTTQEIESLGSPKVKALSVYRLAKFEVMLPRFVDYWRAYGGLEDMLLEPEDADQKDEN